MKTKFFIKETGVLLVLTTMLSSVGVIATNIENQTATSAFVFASSGTTWYVDDVPGIGPGNPPENFTKIQDAINSENVKDGDTIYVFSGTYRSSVRITKSINLFGENRATTILDVTDFSNTDFEDCIAIHSDYVNIKGFTITNADAGGISFREFGKGSHLTIQDCYLHDNGGGIRCFMDDLNDITVSNCIIEKNKLAAIDIGSQWHSGTNGLTNFTINDCKIRKSTDNQFSHGIVVRAYSYDVTILNCEISDLDYGIYLTSQMQIQGVWIPVENILVDNCVIFSCNKGIKMDHTLNSIIKNCNIYENDNGIENDDTVAINKIYHNNFINNIQNAYSEGYNFWDDSYPSGGNFWDDYYYNDITGDGIGDTVYNVPGGDNVDRYPFVRAVGIESSSPLKPAKPSGPTKVRPGVEYTYATCTTDPDGDKVKYCFDWGDGTTTWTGYYNSGETASCKHAWKNTGTFEIKVKAKDFYGYESDWSNPLSCSHSNSYSSSSSSSSSSCLSSSITGGSSLNSGSYIGVPSGSQIATVSQLSAYSSLLFSI